MKCPMCKSRDVINIKNPRERPFKLNDKEEVMIYPQNKCIKCGHEFNMLINHNKNK